MAKKKRTQFSPLTLNLSNPDASSASSKLPPSKSPHPPVDSLMHSSRSNADVQTRPKQTPPATGNLADPAPGAIPDPVPGDGPTARVAPKPFKSDPTKFDQETATKKKKKKQKRKRAAKAVFVPTPDLTGALVIDIGLDKLKEATVQNSKSLAAAEQEKNPEGGKRIQTSSTSTSSSSSEDTASSEPDTSEYSSEEASTSKEEG
ncbi:hypothetical protein YC2023_064733 [Brassica napus]